VIDALRRRFQTRRLDAPRSPARFGAHYDPDAFGRLSEGIARFFGTARYLVFQTIMVISWILIGYIWFGFDDHPRLFLLNLAFSTQAAYAAPLILLAQNRQAERDRLRAEDDRLVNRRVQAEAEFLARELAASRLSLGKIEATLARVEERLERYEEREAEEDAAAE
jgi:uncharacterized membrane protein